MKVVLDGVFLWAHHFPQALADGHGACKCISKFGHGLHVYVTVKVVDHLTCQQNGSYGFEAVMHA